MNNDNFNKLNFMSHDMISNLNKIGHEVLSATLESSIPIINTIVRTDLKTSDYEPINYNISAKNNTVLIMCEIPGLSKEKCKVHYKDNIIRIMGETCYDETWGFIKKKNYYREINVGFINKGSIKIKYSNGCLFIRIARITLDDDSNIEIE
jgi:HSP20 family molecular chaperone IbpA